MNDSEFRKLCERVAKLEKQVGNGLREDIGEIKEVLKQMRSVMEDLTVSIHTIKTMQSVQWWLIGLIIVSFFVERFVK